MARALPRAEYFRESRRLNGRRARSAARAVSFARVAFAGDRGPRQTHPERAARAFAAVHADVAAVQLRQALHEVQPDAQTAARLLVGVPRPGRTARRCASPPTAMPDRRPDLETRSVRRPSCARAPHGARGLNFTAFTIRFTATWRIFTSSTSSSGTPSALLRLERDLGFFASAHARLDAARARPRRARRGAA